MAHLQPLNRVLPIHLGIISTERCCKLGINYDFDVGGDDFIIVVIIYISRGRMMNWKSVKWIKNWCSILRGIYILHLDCLTTSWHSFIRNINLSIDMRVSKRLKPPLFKIPCQFYQVVTLCVHLEQNSQHMKVKSQSKSGTGHCPVPLLPLFHLKLHLDNVLAFTEQMMTLTTTLTGLFWSLMCLPNRKKYHRRWR